MGSYAIFVSIRRFFALLVALSVLFAPAATGAAMATAASHDMQMTEAGHCQAPPANGCHHDKTDGKSCCISMCIAVAVAPSVPAEHPRVRQHVAQFMAPEAYHGLLAELATPPPRLA